MDKRLPCFWIYSYCKVIDNVPKVTNTLFTCYVNNTFYVSSLSHAWQIDGCVLKIDT
jgi:hypothetical protein